MQQIQHYESVKSDIVDGQTNSITNLRESDPMSRCFDCVFFTVSTNDTYSTFCCICSVLFTRIITKERSWGHIEGLSVNVLKWFITTLPRESVNEIAIILNVGDIIRIPLRQRSEIDNFHWNR